MSVYGQVYVFSIAVYGLVAALGLGGLGCAHLDGIVRPDWFRLLRYVGIGFVGVNVVVIAALLVIDKVVA